MFIIFCGHLGSQILQTENAGTDLPFDQYTKALLDSIKPFMCDEMKETMDSFYLKWDNNSPTLDPRIDALYVLDKALEESYSMGDRWECLRQGLMRLPIAVNCGTAGSGKTASLTHQNPILHEERHCTSCIMVEVSPLASCWIPLSRIVTNKSSLQPVFTCAFCTLLCVVV